MVGAHDDIRHALHGDHAAAGDITPNELDLGNCFHADDDAVDVDTDSAFLSLIAKFKLGKAEAFEILTVCMSSSFSSLAVSMSSPWLALKALKMPSKTVRSQRVRFTAHCGFL